MTRYCVRCVVLARVALIGITFATAGPASLARAQTPIPQPSAPVLFCAEQTPPAADRYELQFDGGAWEPLAMDATVDARCGEVNGVTHSFQLAAARFSVGTHTLRVRATNAFGSTEGPIYTVVVGIAPGPFTIRAVIPPGLEE